MPKRTSDAYLSLDQYCLYAEGKLIEPDTGAFTRWLQNNDSFRVEAGDNGYRARKENYTGTDYWYGVKKVAGKLHKRFIGKTEEITHERLSAIARNIRQPSAKSSPEVIQEVDQIDLRQEIVALKAQITAMQEQLTKLVELQQGKKKIA